MMAPWSCRAFNLLLSLYPRGFRDEYGREIAMLFQDRYRYANTAWDRALIWLESLAGLAQEAPKEHCRVILHDLRHAFRTIRNHPLFAASIVVTLALGIGANTAIFSLLNTVALRTLPLKDPGELYTVRIDSPTPMPQRFSWPMYQRLRDNAMPDAMAAMSRVTRLHARIGSAGEIEPASAQLVSGEYFGVLNVPITIGRPLGRADNLKPGAHPVAVISHGYWQRRFGATPDVLGKQLTMNGAPFTIVGVAGEGYSGVWLESPVDLWLPIAMQHDVRYSQNYSAYDSKPSEAWMPQERISWLDIAVRTHHDDEAKVTASLNHALQQLIRPYINQISDPKERQLALQRRLVLDPFGTGFSRLRERFMNPLYLLMAMAGLVLLIACANAANLLLARAAGRQREIAVRMSLGAGRLRLVQQLLTESLLLVLIAGVAALIVSQWASALLLRLAIADAENSAPLLISPDLRVLAFTMAMALVTTLLFGLLPALRSSRVDLSGTLKSSSRSVLGGGMGHARLLVVFQVALSLVLVSGTGLLIRSFRNMVKLDLGYDQEHVMSASLAVQLLPRQTEEQNEAFNRRVIEAVTAVPGVKSASYAMCGVLQGCRSMDGGYSVEGYQSAPREQITFLLNLVAPDYFETMGMRLIEGRTFDGRDMGKHTSVAIVNQSLARKYFAGRSPIGRRIREDTIDTEIVGVVGDARVLNVRDEPIPSVFYPMVGQIARVVEIRTHGDARNAMPDIRRVLREAAPNVPVTRIAVRRDYVDLNLSQDRLILSLSSAFGILALGLAGFGLFGILSFAVARRTPEFGIRIALGASSARVSWSVCREALIIAIAGLALGLPAVIGGARLMNTLLFGVPPQDWSAFAFAAAVLFIVALAAGLLPALRASRVDPVIALRAE